MPRIQSKLTICNLSFKILNYKIEKMEIGTNGEFDHQCAEFRNELLFYARSLCRERPSEAEDLVQATLASAIANKHQLRPGSNIQNWLYRILKNKFLDHVRSAYSMRMVFHNDLVATAGIDFSEREHPEREHNDDKKIAAIELAVLNFRIRCENTMTDDNGISEGDIDDWIQKLMVNYFTPAFLKAYQKIRIAYRVTFILADVLGFSYKDAAAILRISKNTFGNRVFRTRKALQTTLKPALEAL